MTCSTGNKRFYVICKADINQSQELQKRQKRENNTAIITVKFNTDQSEHTMNSCQIFSDLINLSAKSKHILATLTRTKISSSI